MSNKDYLDNENQQNENVNNESDNNQYNAGEANNLEENNTYVLKKDELTQSSEIIKKDEELSSVVHLEEPMQATNVDGINNVNTTINGQETFNNTSNVSGFNYTSNTVNVNDNVVSEETKNKNRYVGLSFALVAVAAVIIFALIYVTGNMVEDKNKGIIGGTTQQAEETPKATIFDKADKDKEVKEVASTDGKTVADIVENVMPSIVSIACVVEQQYNFFGSTFSEDAEGSGSGIIIGQNDKQVLIATNNHVIDGASTVRITFNDGKEVKAEIKGTDASNDLAVVAVAISDLDDDTKDKIKIASVGKSDSCKVGEVAIAIGNALGYGQSVTVGVISALDRSVATEDYNMELIQTDAAINPGNSGGALLNSKGEVIGINSVKYVSEDTEGMGYAIPITEAVEILNELMNYEEIPESKRAYLGIVGVDIDEAISQRSNLPKGVYVQEISKDSPAEKCGMKQGDVIIEFAGKKVSTMENIQNIMKNKRSGEKAEIKVMQASNGKYVEKTYTVTFGSRGKFLD